MEQTFILIIRGCLVFKYDHGKKPSLANKLERTPLNNDLKIQDRQVLAVNSFVESKDDGDAEDDARAKLNLYFNSKVRSKPISIYINNIKIQPKTIDLSTRLWGIPTEFVGFIP